ncbi:MAG TPA: cytochrome-c peroxidase, partial [Vicinamibacterales bacterium]|nr:cytochrome-c peroxidase [Vicinamibacterales bacterium]
GPAPADPTNRVADDPRAADFGRRLFFDSRLSANGQVSCATCHIPDRVFQDGLPLAKGLDVTHRRTIDRRQLLLPVGDNYSCRS